MKSEDLHFLILPTRQILLTGLNSTFPHLIFALNPKEYFLPIRCAKSFGHIDQQSINKQITPSINRKMSKQPPQGQYTYVPISIAVPVFATVQAIPAPDK